MFSPKHPDLAVGARKVGSPIIAASVLFLLGVALTLLLFKLTSDAEMNSLQQILNLEANDEAENLQGALDHSVLVVDSLRRLYDASGEVTPGEFDAFVQPLLARHRYIHALEWAPRVMAAERGPFEAAIRADGLEGFRITERAPDGSVAAATPRAEYFPLRYVVPLAGNESAVGYDMATQSGRIAILEAATDSGEVQVSELFQPVQGGNGQRAFAIISPVYRKGVKLDSAAARREAVKGFVIGLFRVGDFMDTALYNEKPKELVMELRDETEPGAPVLMHVLRSSATNANTGRTAISHRVALETPGRRWTLDVSATPEFIRIHDKNRAKYVLAVGLLLSLLFSAYVFQILRQKAQMVGIAERLSRTNRELQDVRDRLSALIQSAPIGIIALDADERVTEWNPAAERLFGWRREEVLGMLPPMMDRDDPRTYRAVKAGEVIVNVEGERRRKDGTMQPVRIAGATLRDAHGNRTGLLGMFEDLSDVQRSREEARRREAMLEAINLAAHYLLQAECWLQVMPEVLAALGESAQADRAFLWSLHHADDGTALVSRQFDWYAAGISPGDPATLENIPYRATRLGRIVETLARGEAVLGHVVDFSAGERAILESMDVVSLLLVPIRIDGDGWGFIGLDTCHARRDWGAEDVRLLRIAAEGLSAAIRRERFEKRLRQSALVFAHTVDSVVITDANARILDVNPAFTEITGYSRDEAIGAKPSLIKSDHHDRDFYRGMWAALTREGLWSGEIWDRRKNGEAFPGRLTIRAVTGPTGETVNYVGVLTDLTSIRETQDRLDYLVSYDPLTGLPNRRRFTLELEQAIRRAAHSGGLAVLLIDLDHFQDVNNSLGHAVGDALLQEVVGRVVAAIPIGGMTARQGSDEFLVLLEGARDAQAAADAAQTLFDALSVPFKIDGEDLYVRASVGISVYPADGDDADALLRNASAAVVRAKELGRGRFELYTDHLTARARERVALGAHLRRAMDEHQLFLHFQPQIDLRTGQIIGAEALLRWMHPTLGMVSPAKFIPLAEALGLIVPIGEWVLRTACRTARPWCEGSSGFRRIAVNVAGPQLTPQFVQTVRNVLEETGLPPACLELEVTESFIMGQAEGAIQLLHDLKALGIELAIDDFGTGYSSLSYLKHLPIDKLKIDQSFVRGMPNPDDEAIARAVIWLAKSMRLQVIAEGVETEAQRDFLNAEGCDEGQGYLYSKPIPGEAFDELLKCGV